MQSILQTPVQLRTSEGSLATRCLRTVQLVAFCWLLLGNTIQLLTTSAQTQVMHRLHLLGGGALLISAAMFSLLLPLHYVVRRYEREQAEA